MLSARSAIPDDAPLIAEGLSISESPDFHLTQVAGQEAELRRIFPNLPPHVGKSASASGHTILRTGPQQLWCIGKMPEIRNAGIYVTQLSSSRTCITVEGPKARALLSRCAPIDFHDGAFVLGQFAMTGIHHTPVLIHCLAAQSFHVYAMRTFGLSLWDWIVDAAQPIVSDK
jgi:methylglutamate dehydrogenase subunit D